MFSEVPKELIESVDKVSFFVTKFDVPNQIFWQKAGTKWLTRKSGSTHVFFLIQLQLMQIKVYGLQSSF